MALKSQSDSAAVTEAPGPAVDPAYRVSAVPVVPERNGKGHTHADDDLALPRYYGSETLWLLARDPQSLFAYWDIDWEAAFGTESRARKVYLRLLDADGIELKSLEVEPFVGGCSVTVPDADAAYCGEIGYYEPEGFWNAISRSETVLVPPQVEGKSEPADFATVPLHLSFQRMIDAARVGEDGSLTGMLSGLRQRAANGGVTAQQREVVHVIEEAAASEPARRNLVPPDLWAQHSLGKILGFRNSSLSGGFGGSSRS